MKIYAIILASGVGSRYNSDKPKQFEKIGGKTILEHTIEIFDNSIVDAIIVIITPEYRFLCEKILKKNNYKKDIKILNGGATRKESSYIGVSSISDDEAKVIIHDCARPFLSNRIINDCVSALDKYDAIDVAIPSADTIITVDGSIIKNIPDRKLLMRGQTPQCFKLSLIRKAHELCKNDDNFTDDCGMIVKNNLSKVYVVNGENENIKITYPSDIYIADKIFQFKKIEMSNDIDLTKLKKKVIVVFGGNSEIGSEIIELAKNFGAIIYAFSRVNGCDICDYKNVQKVLKDVYEKENAIDLIINSTSILKLEKLENRDISDITNEIMINYIGAVNIAKASIEYLKKSKGELQLYACSLYIRGRELYSTYSSSKAAIVNFSQALSEELYEYGIRVNVISPEKSELLRPKEVAYKSLCTFLSNVNGQVVDIKV